MLKNELVSKSINLISLFSSINILLGCKSPSAIPYECIFFKPLNMFINIFLVALIYLLVFFELYENGKFLDNQSLNGIPVKYSCAR